MKKQEANPAMQTDVCPVYRDDGPVRMPEFFDNRADEAMELLWADGTWNEETLRSLARCDG